MKIAVDVDGTIADSHKSFVKYVNAAFEKELREKALYPLAVEDITDWDWGEKIRALHLSPKDCVEITDRIWREETDSIPPTEEGLRKRMAELQERCECVDIVTARKETEAVKRWLELNRIPYNRLVYYTKKEQLDYDVYVDDNPNLAASVPDTKTILLYHRPWNTKVCCKSNVKRVHDFGEVLGEVSGQTVPLRKAS